MTLLPLPRIAVVLAALSAAAACGGSPAGRPEPGWPPEEPRQPERLLIAEPTIADPLQWWQVNIRSPLPPDIYQDAAQAQAAERTAIAANQVRARYGLEPAVRLPELDFIAQAHARDQAIRDYWSHWTPEGLGSGARIQAGSGLAITAGGENSSIATPDVHTPGQIVQGWLEHAGHRELLLSPQVRFSGVGVYNYGPGEWTYYVHLLVDLPGS